MSLSAAFAAALARDCPSLAAGNLWLELEGLPYAFGLNTATSAWFAARTAQWRREGILAVLSAMPSSVEQEAKVREGDASVGSLTARFAEDDNGLVLGLVANTGRRDGWVYLGAPRWKANTVYVATGDVVRPTTASAAPGAGKWFRCTAGGTSHATTEPTWPAAGAVADGTVVWTAEADQGLPATSTQVTRVPFTGAAGSALTLYLGRETLKVASATQGNGCGYFSTVDRGRYLMEGQASAWAHDDGDVISTYPRFSVGRRGRLYAALDGCVDADKLARWSGVVTRAPMADGLLEVELELSSTWEQLSRKRFTNQWKGKLFFNVLGAAPASPPLFPAVSYRELCYAYGPLSTDPVDPYNAAGFRFYRMGDEIVLGDGAAANSIGGNFYSYIDTAADYLGFTVGGRGVFGTAAAAHSAGDEIKEVIAVRAAAAGDVVASESRTRFSRGDNVISVLLQLWLSRKGDGANGTYDVLPEGWGVGLDQAFVDVAGIEAIRDRWLPHARVTFLIDEPYDAHELSVALLRPFGLYPVMLTGDRLSVRRRAPPMPDTVVRTLDSSVIKRVLSWSQDVLTQPVALLFRADKELLADAYHQRYAIVFVGPGAEGQEFYGEDAPTVEVQSRGSHTGAIGHDWNESADDAAIDLGEIIRDRDALPSPVVELECSYDVQDLEQGDYVYVTDTEIPDVTTGQRGVTAIPMEVLTRAVDEDGGGVRLKLQQVPRAWNSRLIAPSAVANSVNAGALRIYPEEHLFTSSAGSRDLTKFAVGDVVAVYSADLLTKRGEATVTAVIDGALGIGYIQLGAWPAGTVATDVVMLSDYGTATASRKARNAFMADSGGKLGADPGHEYV